jgi:hypothetical protein
MAPLRLAGSMTFGFRTATSVDLVTDGEAGGAAVKLNARFDGGTGGWRTGRADITATVNSANSAAVARLLLAEASPAGSGPGRVLVKATGIPEEGLTTFASLEAADTTLTFRGQVTAAEAGTKATGELEFRAENGAAVVALAGLSPPLKVDGLPISGRLNLNLADGTVGIEKMSASVGGGRLAGRIKLSQSGERRHIDATLDADDTSIARLLAPMLDQRLAITGAAEAAISGRHSVWPDEPFSAPALDAFIGTIRLDTRRLTLTDGIVLNGAKLAITLEPGKIEIEDIAGKGLGGQFKARLTLAKAPAGAELRGSLSFGAELAAFSDGAPPRASGTVSGKLDFAGRGLSPRAVMQTLQGQGRIDFGEAKLDTLWPGAIPLAVDAAIKAEPDKLAAAVRRGLAAGLSTGNLPLGQKMLALELADGQLRVKSFAVDTREGRATGIASLDLKSLTFDSQWRLEAKAGVAGAGGKPLPAVTIFYSGPAAALGALEARIDSSALEQEIFTRKI